MDILTGGMLSVGLAIITVGGPLAYYQFVYPWRKTRYLRTPLPKKSANVVVASLKKIESAQYRRWLGDVQLPSEQISGIIGDIERYYTALDGRPDGKLVFLKIERFAEETISNYQTLVAFGRYANRKSLDTCIQEIEQFAKYMYQVAERATTEQINGTYGAIVMREEERSLERELEALGTEKALPPILNRVKSAVKTALARRVPQ